MTAIVEFPPQVCPTGHFLLLLSFSAPRPLSTSSNRSMFNMVERSGSSQAQGTISGEPIEEAQVLVNFEGPNDPEMAANWPRSRKWLIVSVLAAMSFIVYEMRKPPFSVCLVLMLCLLVPWAHPSRRQVSIKLCSTSIKTAKCSVP